MFVSLFFSLILLVNLSVFVSATHNDDGLDPNDYFYCHDSDEHVNITFSDDGKGFSKSGIIGSLAYFEKGETYGKERLYSDDFVTKGDTCVVTETIPVTEEELIQNEEVDKATRKLLKSLINDKKILNEEIENSKWVKKIQELQYNEGAQLVSPIEGKLYLIRCASGDCNSARVESCEGDNSCRVLENWCSVSATANDYFKLLFKHPFQAIRLLFGDVSAQSVYSTVSTNPCKNGCVDGACIPDEEGIFLKKVGDDGLISLESCDQEKGFNLYCPNYPDESDCKCVISKPYDEDPFGIL